MAKDKDPDKVPPFPTRGGSYELMPDGTLREILPGAEETGAETAASKPAGASGLVPAPASKEA